MRIFAQEMAMTDDSDDDDVSDDDDDEDARSCTVIDDPTLDNLLEFVFIVIEHEALTGSASESTRGRRSARQ
jgi:hypothetical protein